MDSFANLVHIANVDGDVGSSFPPSSFMQFQPLCTSPTTNTKTTYFNINYFPYIPSSPSSPSQDSYGDRQASTSIQSANKSSFSSNTTTTTTSSSWKCGTYFSPLIIDDNTYRYIMYYNLVLLLDIFTHEPQCYMEFYIKKRVCFCASVFLMHFSLSQLTMLLLILYRCVHFVFVPTVRHTTHTLAMH